MSSPCDDCLEQASVSTDKCLQCEHFLNLLKSSAPQRRSERPLTAHGSRFMQVLSVSIAVGGVITAIADLPAVGLGMVLFALGLWLADYLTYD